MIEKAKAIKKLYEKEWLTKKGIVAVGIGKVSADRIGLIISVVEDVNKFRNQIPTEIDGIPIQIQKTGELKAL